MKLDRGPVPIDFARELVAEALEVASKSADAELQAAFVEEKEAVQSIEIVDIREKRLDALDSHWIDRFRVSAPLESVLGRQPGVADLISRCFLELARGKANERAFLLSSDARAADGALGKPSLVVQLTAATLLEREELEPLVVTTLAKARRPT